MNGLFYSTLKRAILAFWYGGRGSMFFLLNNHEANIPYPLCSPWTSDTRKNKKNKFVVALQEGVGKNYVAFNPSDLLQFHRGQGLHKVYIEHQIHVTNN